MVSVKDVVSTGKVIWIEAAGAKSSPVRFVSEGETIYVLQDGENESLPPLSDGDRVTIAGHPLAKQTIAGKSPATVKMLEAIDAPRGAVLDLAGRRYDPALSPDENFEALRGDLGVIAITLA